MVTLGSFAYCGTHGQSSQIYSREGSCFASSSQCARSESGTTVVSLVIARASSREDGFGRAHRQETTPVFSRPVEMNSSKAMSTYVSFGTSSYGCTGCKLSTFEAIRRRTGRLRASSGTEAIKASVVGPCVAGLGAVGVGVVGVGAVGVGTVGFGTVGFCTAGFGTVGGGAAGRGDSLGTTPASTWPLQQHNIVARRGANDSRRSDEWSKAVVNGVRRWSTE
mmetsp:Transcript_10309/g.21927  ORF Transcript_10309/g.21927 Transcript_10309/m.21927 type:complete len:222 (-) Transcript_10309:45-710(-)